MIAEGFFTTGEPFYLRDGREIATLLADGKLSFEGEAFDMHMLAAKVRGVKATRLNGFDVWRVKRNGELVPITRIRDEYRASLAALVD